MAAVKIPQQLQKYYPALIELPLLSLAFLTSLLLAPLFTAPFKNPYNISNPLNPSGFNPDNNFYGIILVIIITLGLFYGLKQLYRSKYSWTIKLLVMGLLALNFFLINSLGSPGYATGPNGLDNFHAGEQLAPTQAFLSGRSLFDEIFYLRGAGIDAVLPAIGFSVLGKSVGSFLVMSDMFMIIALLSFATLLAFLIRNPLAYALAIFIFYVSDAVSLIHVRDVPVWIVIGLVLLLFKLGITTLQKRMLLGAIGCISSLMLYFSIDRGVLLLGLALALAAAIIVFAPDKTNRYSLHLEAWRQNILTSLYVIAGVLTGIALPALLIGWESFKAFVKMTFFEIPAFGGLLVSQPFPTIFGPTYLFWGPVILVISTAYLLSKLYGTKLPKDYNRLVPYSLIFIFGVLCLKVGANRIALSKLASVTAPLFLIAILILILAIRLAYKHRAERTQLVPAILLTIFTLTLFSQLNFSRVLFVPDYSRAKLAAYKNLPNTPDDDWISPETRDVRNYILKNTSKDDYIFAFTSNPIYYYLTGRQNPTRYYASWFADPQPYTTEALNDLKRHKPKVIIYKEGSWMDAPDTVTMEQRIPEINDWILKNYPNKVVIDNTTLLRQ